MFGIQSFWSFHFESWSKFKIVSSLQSIQHRIPSAFVNFDKAYNRWKALEVLYIFGIQLLVEIQPQ
jgi:hypothetical protein